MTIAVTSALAPTFAWTATAADIRLTIAGPTVCDAVIPSGDYRMSLGSVSTGVKDFVVEADKQVGNALGGTGVTATLTLGADGIVTLSLSASATLAAGLAARMLGLTPGTGTTFRGTRPPWYLALFASVTGGTWSPVQTGGAEQLSDGRVYSVGSTATSWQRSSVARFVPWSPAVRAEYDTGATALWPADAYLADLGSTATDREWSVLDVLQVARNSVCGLALGTWQTVRASTTARYDRAYVAPATLLSPQVDRQDDAWEAFVDLPLALTRPATSPTDTRA